MTVSLDNLTVRLGAGPDARVAIDGITLEFAAAEQVAIIGPSGAGKTTLLHTLACAHKPAVGRLLLGGQDPWVLNDADRHRLRARAFLAPQAPPLPPRQRVITAVLAGQLPQLSTWQALRSLVYPLNPGAAREALAAFKLEDKLTLRCDRLSGGERQRVGLARMLLSNAPLILLDEPVSALDPVLGAAALKTVQVEATARKATLVVSLHDVNLARRQFERLIGIRDGRVQFDLPSGDVTDELLAQLYGAELSMAGDDLPAADDAEPKLTRCF
jgi:phosphonate transport system ATP-binding protein